MNELCEANCVRQEEPIYNVDRYTITIDELDFGYIIRVGCKSFAFEERERMIEKLLGYLKNPAEKQRQFYETKTI